MNSMFRRSNFGTLAVFEATIDDAMLYTKPFTVRVNQRTVSMVYQGNHRALIPATRTSVWTHYIEPPAWTKKPADAKPADTK